jgi:hypothetical protein|eukprot:SAG25_NODE_183_length_12476_cov_9.734427_3_plen_259_part_00
MSGSIVVRAHEEATLAEQAYRRGDHRTALDLHRRAMKSFRAGAASTPDAANQQAMQLLAEAQRSRAASAQRRVDPGATLGGADPAGSAPGGEGRANQLPPAQAVHATKTQLHPPATSQPSHAAPTAAVAPPGRGLPSSALTAEGALAPYEPPSMRMQRNAPAAWSEWPFLPVPVQNLFDQLTHLMDLLPNVAPMAADATPASASSRVGGAVASGDFGQEDTGVGSMIMVRLSDDSIHRRVTSRLCCNARTCLPRRRTQ